MKKDDGRFSKSDTVALWHAVQWMETVLKGWLRDGFQTDEERAQYDAERGRLAAAKHALRKANAIRKSQAATSKLRELAHCRPTTTRQAARTTAGGPP